MRIILANIALALFVLAAFILNRIDCIQHRSGLDMFAFKKIPKKTIIDLEKERQERVDKRRKDEATRRIIIEFLERGYVSTSVLRDFYTGRY
jgi:hypothetical protein